MHRILAALAAVLFPALATSAEPTFLGSYHWVYPKFYFGGFSGIEVSENGVELLTIGDAGQIVDGRLIRKEGRIVGVDFQHVKSLHTPDGRRVTGVEEFDAEGLAVAQDGTFYVSFEHDARVWSYTRPRGNATPLPRHPDFGHMLRNRALEALAIGSDGSLYTLAELPPRTIGPRQLYRFKDGAWDTFGTIPSHGLFWPVGADISSDGFFYLLERRFAPILGFSSQVRRFRIGAEGLEDEEILLQTPLGRHDNLEGIAVWEDEGERVRITLISDDNRRASQRTEIVEYALPPLAPDGETR